MSPILVIPEGFFISPLFFAVFFPTLLLGMLIGAIWKHNHQNEFTKANFHVVGLLVLWIFYLGINTYIVIYDKALSVFVHGLIITVLGFGSGLNSVQIVSILTAFKGSPK